MSAQTRKYHEWNAPVSFWPQEVSHDPSLKIGEVLAILKSEFPFLAASKIRYYESQELIFPKRTASNQRLFSLADVERLRFILIEQRDRYVSLPQIKELLKQLDCGSAEREHPGKLRALRDTDKYAVKPGTRLQKGELAALVGISVADVEDYVRAGIIAIDSRGRLTSQAADILRYAELLKKAGIDLRILKSVRNSAHSHAVNVVNLLATERSRVSALAKERAVAQTAEFSIMLTNYYRALLVENIDVELR